MLDFIIAAHTAMPTGLGGIWDAIVTDFSKLNTAAAWVVFGQVLMIDIMLAGDNAIVVGALAAGLPAVSWKMWRELQHSGQSHGSPEVEGDEDSGLKPAKSFAAAAWAVAVADVSMSLDNVLAVAGAAREHPGILIIGLLLAVALMGVAANILAKYIERYRWIAWFGLLVIVYVAGKMIYEGYVDPNVGLGTLFG
jgi:predicted tellurium resistance membrane protein TerC